MIPAPVPEPVPVYSPLLETIFFDHPARMRTGELAHYAM